MAESTDELVQKKIIFMEQMEQMFQMFQKLNKTTSQTENPTTVWISEKLTYHKYTKWCKLMHVAVGGRGRLSHITAASPPPIDPDYAQWEQRDTMLKVYGRELKIS